MRILGVGALLAAGFSCSQTNCPPSHELVESGVIRSLHIPLRGEQYNHAFSAFYQSGDTALLLGLDSDVKAIDFYDLTRERFVRRLPLATEGPDAILSPKAFVIHNLDSIFISNENNQIFLINRAGQRTGFWDFNFQLPDSITARDSGLTGEFIFAAMGDTDFLHLPFHYRVKDNSLVARVIPLTTKSRGDEYAAIYRAPGLAAFSLATGSITRLMGKYPAEFFAKEKPHNPYAHFAIVADDVWLQFDSSPKVYSVERDTFFCQPSRFASGQITRFHEDEAVDEEVEISSHHTDELFLGIYYDPYRQVVYRIFQHAQPEKDLEGRRNQKLQAPFSILVVRPDGHVIGEARFEANRYNFLHIFVTPQGLLISRENPYDSGNDEERYSFDLIRLKFDNNEKVSE